MDVLIIEDSSSIGFTVEKILTKNRHTARIVETLADADRELALHEPDLVVLDLSLPDGDGVEWCVNVRPRTDAYILMLTGRTEEVDRITGLRCGADDYIGKPFSPREFEARVQAIARRLDMTAGKGLQPGPSTIEHGPVALDRARRVVRVDDEVLDLTRVEFELLSLLLRNPTQVLTRAMILERVWGHDYYGQDHVLDVHIGNLRRKLRDRGVVSLIRTVRGVGYGLGLDDA